MFALTLLWPGLAFAQLSDDSRDQQEAKQEQRQEDLERLRELQTTPKTAEESLEKLKERAKERITEKRRAELLKTKFSANFSTGYESNPANTQDILVKGDSWWENSLSGDWIPKFTKQLSADFGYNLTIKNFFEQGTLSNDNHSLNASLKILPFKSGKLTLEPGAKKEWNIYLTDSSSSFEQYKLFTKLSHILNQRWSYGGKYEYAYKEYDKKAPIDDSGANFNFHRADHRNSLELWLKRQLGKYSLKLKEKSYRNNSNSQSNHYDDYDDHDAEISLSGAFLKDNKLYMILTSDYEWKNYRKRAGDDAVARADRALQYRLNSYYTLTKNFSLSYTFSVKNNNSNKGSGEFRDITNSLGLTINF